MTCFQTFRDSFQTYSPNLGFVVVMPNYSRHPYGHIEDMIDDVDQVFDWVLNNVSGWGGHHNKIILFGHSAGASLTDFDL